jgi:shikimate kinase
MFERRMNKPVTSFTPVRTVALIGMMAAGKSSVGSRLAARLKMPFFDSDAIMEKETGLSIAAYFERFGEDKFRAFEREMVTKLLQGAPCVLALGGGAFMNADTRALLKRRAATVWIKAEKSVLLERALRHGGRPLLQGDPEARMTELLAVREPVYAEADITVASGAHPIDVTVGKIMNALEGCARASEAAS